MSLRILFATHCPANDRTAVYRSISDRARYLRQEGHTVDILTPADLLRSRAARLDPLVLPPALAPRLGEYDVVVFHSYMGWAFHACRRLFDPRGRVRTITAFHGLEPLYQQALSDECRRHGGRLSLRFRLLHHMILPRLLKYSCRRSDAVFCLNSSELAYLTRHGWAERDRIRLVANGVAEDGFLERAHRPSARHLLFVGQWLPAKGVRYLVEAFTAIAAERDIELSCVGTGAPAEVVLSAFPPPVRPQVRVLPSVDRSQLHEELGRADVFVFPSLSEGFSCALLEALAAGLPTVATPAGAAIDLLNDGVNALVVPLASAAALRSATERVLDDEALRARLGRAGRETAMNYRLDETCASYARSVSGVATAERARQPFGEAVGDVASSERDSCV